MKIYDNKFLGYNNTNPLWLSKKSEKSSFYSDENLENIKSKTITSVNKNFDVVLSFCGESFSVSAKLINRISRESFVIKPENLSKDLLKVSNKKAFDAYTNYVRVRVAELPDSEYKIYTDVNGLGGGRGSKNQREYIEATEKAVDDQAKKSGYNVHGVEKKPWYTKVWNAVSDYFTAKEVWPHVSHVVTTYIWPVIRTVASSVPPCNIF